ncbi:MAG: sigma-54-dependent Fis family transcriptional regulator, partial [Myxococcales bacterium]|nr:sigma-54-dependent Fis family transcriptional regulator [Myxococcales bacterium]
DEVGEIPLDLQGKLLRVLQEGSYERVGEEQTREVDVRIVAATNRDLRAEVAAGRFREDLYYRLDVFPIEVAPLRERREDISALADHFIARTAHRLGRRVPRLDGKSYAALRGYDWPGNVRELQNVLERAIITWRGGPLRVDLKLSSATRTSGQKVSSSTSDADRVGESPILTDLELRDRERENIEAALRRTRWKIAGPGGAAELIGVRPSTLASRIKKLGVERPI